MPSSPDTITRLWTAARTMFARMREAIGALSDDDHRAARAWLRPIEIMARKIVLTHALALIRGDTHASTGAPKVSKTVAVRVCHPGKQPALITIPIPPQVRVVAPTTAASSPTRARPPSLRLWPRTPPSAGPRVRTLAPSPLVVTSQRDQGRLAFARRMRATPRRPEPERLARRIEALTRLLDKPLAAARRFARVLARRPHLALKLALKPAPRTRLYDEPEYKQASDQARDSFYEWTMQPARDSS